MGVLAKYSKVMGKTISVLEKESKEYLKILADEITVDIKEIIVEERDLIKRDEEISSEIQNLQQEQEKYEKYSKRAVQAGDNEGASRFLEKKYEVEEKKTELIKKQKNVRDNISKLFSMKTKLESEIKQIEETLCKI